MSHRPVPDQVITLHPLVRRILAENPSPFTLDGTQTYIVGRGEVAVIDPGPALSKHIDAILGATEGERIAHIVCTHTHPDHFPAAGPLKAATGARITGCSPTGDEAILAKADYAPDLILRDGDRIRGPGWTLEAVATPGHASNHICYALPEANALFSGDHVMGWATTVVVPPDGDMADYMASLDRLLQRNEAVYYPAHGDPIEDPSDRLRRLVAHRRQRERQILDLLQGQALTVPAMVARIYANIDPQLHAAAGRSLSAHLIDLQRRGVAANAGAEWSIVG